MSENFKEEKVEEKKLTKEEILRMQLNQQTFQTLAATKAMLSERKVKFTMQQEAIEAQLKQLEIDEETLTRQEEQHEETSKDFGINVKKRLDITTDSWTFDIITGIVKEIEEKEESK